MMTALFAVGIFLSLLIGVALGLLGGGGSILTVPILHYIFGLSAGEATTLSLFVVGFTAAVGAYAYASRGEIAWKEGILFALPSFIVVFLMRRFVLPALPAEFYFMNVSLSKDKLILLTFSLVMLAAASAMVRPSRTRTSHHPQPTLLKVILIALQGVAVGAVTGFVGAGGGFLIVPALVVLVGLDMKRAVGTSLVVIAANSLIGFWGALSSGATINVSVLLTVSAAALVGMLAGSRFVTKVSNEKLKPAFGYFVLIMAILILMKETILK
jgi:uncharacterized membrane protein YfcA